MAIEHTTPEHLVRCLAFMRALVENSGERLPVDPDFPSGSQARLTEALLRTAVAQADRLETLETTLESALAVAYDNYDPIVAQLSEVRREIARMHADRSTVLADRDRLWCEALLLVDWGVNDGLKYVQAVLKRFDELHLKDDRPSW